LLQTATRSYGPAIQRYSVALVVIGEHLPEGEPPLFTYRATDTRREY
jgi:hypothetical protein